MNLTDAEIIELEQLLKDQEIDLLKDGLVNFNDKTNPNYKFLHDGVKNQKYDFKHELTEGYRGCILEGSSRSGKTWSGIDVIIWICLYVETNCVINIYRETYNEFKTTLYDDFKRRLDDFALPNKFHTAEDVKSFKIGKNKIFFLGCDKVGKAHGGGCDYAFFNEMMHIPQPIFDQVEMRCRKFWWGDYNPSVTDHWVFDSVIPREDVGFLRTTFLDNPFITPQERNKILSYEPWLPGSYEIHESVITYNGEVVTEFNQPPPHPKNIDRGTADEFMWKVYGLGLRGAMKGLIFQVVHYIDEFPDIGYSYGMDFGFTTDPTALVRYAEDSHNIWLELLLYQPTERPELIDSYMDKIGIERHLPITCDSSDKYTGENKGTVEMVRSLDEMGWKVSKVSKKKSIMFWLTSMKKKRIHIVKNHLWKHAKKEQENYRMKEINGIAINQPEDKYNHFWDASKYGHIAYNDEEYEVVW